MMDIELFAQTALREREHYFATPEFKARASWRDNLEKLTHRQPRQPRLRRAGEAPRGTVALY